MNQLQTVLSNSLPPKFGFFPGLIYGRFNKDDIVVSQTSWIGADPNGRGSATLYHAAKNDECPNPERRKKLSLTVSSAYSLPVCVSVRHTTQGYWSLAVSRCEAVHNEPASTRWPQTRRPPGPKLHASHEDLGDWHGLLLSS